MQMTIFGFVACCHEVCRLLSNECLGHRCFNSTFILTFCSKRLLHPLSCVAPTILHGPPNRSSVGRCKIKCCIGLKKLGGKIISNLQINSGANSSISSTRSGDSSLAQRTQKKLLSSASTSHPSSGMKPRNITALPAQSICFNHDS